MEYCKQKVEEVLKELNVDVEKGFSNEEVEKRKAHISLLYAEKREEIQKRLANFQNLPKKAWLYELIFCLLTPQSSGRRCWEAVLKLEASNFKNIENILKTRTRFHKTKTMRVKTALQDWPKIKKIIEETSNAFTLRNSLSENVKGFGMKESSHFIRNIGKSENQLAILDRHVLKNLSAYSIINANKVKIDKKNYLEIERKMKQFADEVNIPVDALDLLLWSKETGEVFK